MHPFTRCLVSEFHLTDTSPTRFLETSEFSDFTIVCEEYEFKTHKLVLCAESHYFWKLCKGHFKARRSCSMCVARIF